METGRPNPVGQREAAGEGNAATLQGTQPLQTSFSSRECRKGQRSDNHGWSFCLGESSSVPKTAHKA